MPALIYLIYIVVHITIDTYYGLYNMAFVKIWIGIIVTLLLNIMCENNMSFFAWLIIAIPFILMTIIAVFILYTLGLDPATGKAKTTTSTVSTSSTTSTPTTASTAVTTPIYTTSAIAPLYPTTTPAKLTIYSNTAPPTPSQTPSVTNTAFTSIPPPSIYANPVSVNYHGVLADSVRSMQSNFS